MAKGKLSDAVPARVLGIAAHADDLDFMASGTLARWCLSGTEVYYLILTDGSKGTEDKNIDPAELVLIRQQEQQKAAEMLGVKDVFFGGYEDGLLQATAAVKRDIVRIIRTIKPDAVVTIDPTMLYVPERSFINHTDHRAAGQAAIDAVFPLARDHLSFPELYRDEGLEPHKVQSLYLIHFGKETVFFDIAGTIDLKLQALLAHPSQIADQDRLISRIRSLAAADGQKAGVDYAEGFIHVPIG